MVLSLVATAIQLDLLLHAGVEMTALKLPSAISTCEWAAKAASFSDRSAAKLFAELRRVEVIKAV